MSPLSTPRPGPGDPGWTTPMWDDPALTELAHLLRVAHRRIAPVPVHDRRRLTRQLLIITDLAKRDAALAGRRLAAFMAEFEGERASGERLDQQAP